MKPYWSDGCCTLWHGDSRELIEDLRPAFDFLLTDPPYELEAGRNGRVGRIKGTNAYLDKTMKELYSGFDISILKGVPNWAVFCAKGQLKKVLSETDGYTWNLVTWNKPNPAPLCNGKYLPDTEYIVHAYQPGRLFGEYKDKSRFIVHPSERHPFAHPTVKPIAVMSKMVRLGTLEGETILDPFAGTGSTMVAARNLGRKSVGIEISERYCEIAARRLSQRQMDYAEEVPSVVLS
jgi:site-specific DNA-methyltransferase (adenine-specific)